MALIFPKLTTAVAHHPPRHPSLIHPGSRLPRPRRPRREAHRRTRRRQDNNLQRTLHLPLRIIDPRRLSRHLHRGQRRRDTMRHSLDPIRRRDYGSHDCDTQNRDRRVLCADPYAERLWTDTAE